MRRHNQVIGCSRYTSDWLIERGIPEAKVRSVLNSYVPADPSSGAATDGGASNKSVETVLLYAGRLVAGKGLEHLMEATASSPGTLLRVLGDGPLRSRLESRANRLGANVRFLGHHKDPGPYYESSDIVVLPSRMEALPMTLIEAGYFGKPSIATDSGGISEVVVGEKTGLLYRYGDTAALRRAIERLQSRSLREQFGSAARSRWESEFSGERMGRELAEIYLSAASSP